MTAIGSGYCKVGYDSVLSQIWAAIFYDELIFIELKQILCKAPIFI